MARKCVLVCNSRFGYCTSPVEYPSISKAVAAAKESGWFAYRVFAGGKVVRRGFCERR